MLLTISPLQGWLGHCKMPVSDYVNDTKSVIDQMGRLLAAMAYVCSGDGEEEKFGMLDVVYAIVGARQCLKSRCYGGGEDALLCSVDVRSFQEENFQSLKVLKNEGVLDSQDTGGCLRLLQRSTFEGEKSKAFARAMSKRGRGGRGRSVAESLQRKCTSEVINSRFDSEGNFVELELSIESVEDGRGGSGKSGKIDERSVVVLIGNRETRSLVGSKHFKIHSNKWRKTTQIEVNRGGGGRLFARICHEFVRGYDYELEI